MVLREAHSASFGLSGGQRACFGGAPRTRPLGAVERRARSRRQTPAQKFALLELFPVWLAGPPVRPPWSSAVRPRFSVGFFAAGRDVRFVNCNIHFGCSMTKAARTTTTRGSPRRKKAPSGFDATGDALGVICEGLGEAISNRDCAREFSGTVALITARATAGRAGRPCPETRDHIIRRLTAFASLAPHNLPHLARSPHFAPGMAALREMIVFWGMSRAGRLSKSPDRIHEMRARVRMLQNELQNIVLQNEIAERAANRRQQLINLMLRAAA